MGSLEEVHMPQNGINYAGVMALASAMRHNPDIRVLNFNDNTFTKKGTLAMAQVRSRLCVPCQTADLAVALRFPVTFPSASQSLRHLRNVQVVNFGDCLVRSEGAIALAAVLREGLPVLKVSLSTAWHVVCPRHPCHQADSDALPCHSCFPGA